MRRRIDQISRITGGTPASQQTHTVSETTDSGGYTGNMSSASDPGLYRIASETADSGRYGGMFSASASESEITSSEHSQALRKPLLRATLQQAGEVCVTKRHLSEPIDSLRGSIITTESSASQGVGAVTSASLSDSSVEKPGSAGGNIVNQRGADGVPASVPGNTMQRGTVGVPVSASRNVIQLVQVTRGQTQVQGGKPTTSAPQAKVMYLVPAKLLSQGKAPLKAPVLNPMLKTRVQPQATQRNVKIFSTGAPIGAALTTVKRPYMGDPDVIIQGEDLMGSRESQYGAPMGSPLNLSCRESDSGSDISQALSVPLMSQSERNGTRFAGHLPRASHSDSEAATLVFTGTLPASQLAHAPSTGSQPSNQQGASSTITGPLPANQQRASSTITRSVLTNQEDSRTSPKEVWYPDSRGSPGNLKSCQSEARNLQSEAGNVTKETGSAQDDPDCYITSDSHSVDPAMHSVDLSVHSVDLSMHSVDPSSTGRASPEDNQTIHSALQERLVRNLPGNEPQRRQIIAIPVQMRADKIVVFCEDKLRMEWAYDSSCL